MAVPATDWIALALLLSGTVCLYTGLWLKGWSASNWPYDWRVTALGWVAAAFIGAAIVVKMWAGP